MNWRPAARKVDPALVRYLGWSWMSLLATRAEGTGYVPTLLLRTFEPGSRGSRDTPVFYARLGDRMVIVGSRGGDPREPRWSRNLRAEPRAVAWVRRRRREVRATLLEGSEREAAWRALTDAYPAYADYATRAAPTRELPVFRLDAAVADPEDERDRLWAVHQIRQLAYRYAYAIDSADEQLAESLFVETADALPSPYLDIHRMRNRTLPASSRGPSMLFVANHLIEFDGRDAAHGTVYCFVTIEIDGAFVEQKVIYRDRYVRRNGSWLFRDREHLLWFGEERDPSPLSQPPAEWPQRQVGSGPAIETIRRGGSS